MGFVGLLWVFLQCFPHCHQHLHAPVLVQVGAGRGGAAVPTRCIFNLDICIYHMSWSCELPSCYTVNTIKTFISTVFLPEAVLFSHEKAPDTNYSSGKEEILLRYPQLPLSPSVPTVPLVWFPSYTWVTSSQREP